MDEPRRGFAQDFGIPGSDPFDQDLWPRTRERHAIHADDPYAYLRPDECQACEWLLEQVTTRSLDRALVRRLA